MDNGEIEFLSIADNLYFHRVFMRTNRVACVEKEEPKADEKEILNFILEVFNYVLPRQNITVSLNLDSSVKSYFRTCIGEAAMEKCAIEESLKIAKEYKFDEEEFLRLKEKERSDDVKATIKKIVTNTTPVNISFIYALAFACYACGIIYKQGQSLMLTLTLNEIALDATTIFKSHFPYEWIYYDFEVWALAYTFRHKQPHGE